MNGTFSGLNPVLQALLAGLFTWGVTALGAAIVFFKKEFNRHLLNGMLGFAAGVMIAASFWSLLAPAIAIAAEGPLPKWLPALIGFLVGGAFLWLMDKLLPHLHPGLSLNQAEGIKTHWRGTILLVLAITLHNIPEGLALGVAFGAVAANLPSATLAGAVALALGIGLQNFPEGMAVSIPLRRECLLPGRCFFYGQLSAVVEPLAAVCGAAAVLRMRHMLPYAMAFAAGAMIYVVVEEVIPEAQRGENSDFATLGAMVGFALMMFLDVALGG
ncbi:MAG: ZIP family metal transporter [Candidatus Aminicenantes bacterium]|nr:ZIP family metal transporter [Candidatus Aminicenantes bacterium]